MARTLRPGPQQRPHDPQHARERAALEPVGRVAGRVAAGLVDGRRAWPRARRRERARGGRSCPRRRGLAPSGHGRRRRRGSAARRPRAGCVAVECRSNRDASPDLVEREGEPDVLEPVGRVSGGSTSAVAPRWSGVPGVRPLLGAGRDQPHVARPAPARWRARGRGRPASRRRTRCRRRRATGGTLSACAIAITRQSPGASLIADHVARHALARHAEALIAHAAARRPGSAPRPAGAPLAPPPTPPAADPAARATPRSCRPPRSDGADAATRHSTRENVADHETIGRGTLTYRT